MTFWHLIGLYVIVTVYRMELSYKLIYNPHNYV
jgi:hypothetical protein